MESALLEAEKKNLVTCSSSEMASAESQFFDFLIIGGGIAGVSCARELLLKLPPTASVGLLSCTDTIKHVSKETPLTRNLVEVEVEELNKTQAKEKFEVTEKAQ